MTDGETDTTMTTDRVTNIELGTLLGLSHVQVHRIRTGTRHPSVEAMSRIKDHLGWDIGSQVKARMSGGGRYAREFEKAVERYAASRKTDEGPGERTPDPHSN